MRSIRRDSRVHDPGLPGAAASRPTSRRGIGAIIQRPLRTRQTMQIVQGILAIDVQQRQAGRAKSFFTIVRNKW